MIFLFMQMQAFTITPSPRPPLTVEWKDANGQKVSLAAFRGKVVMLNFWASWCPPCRAEHPKLLELSEQGIQIIGVNFNDKEKNAKSYLLESGNPFSSIAFDPSGKTAIDWGVTAPPETFILNSQGVVIFRFAGPLVGTDYENRFVPALKKALEQ